MKTYVSMIYSIPSSKMQKSQENIFFDMLSNVICLLVIEAWPTPEYRMSGNISGLKIGSIETTAIKPHCKNTWVLLCDPSAESAILYPEMGRIG